MAGTLSSGRPGGNPELEKHQFQAKGDEPLTEKISVRLTSSTKQFLESLGKDYPEFVREAIAEKIERHKAAELTRTETTELATVGQQLENNQTNLLSQAEETDPSQPEQAATPGKRRKADQTQGQTQEKPKTQSRGRKNSATEN
ncbi:hypothetical protein Nos7524_5658 (plasmid) [Nostoc sp. PCC 7524]|uniref:hypothetical protein n=1 Tax=Nostoc sp. (strain ATCC 29411 / PCC 7524) TaxID=28072 RepID=UPI00029F332C|nr:hypothetical protein [Nostoc sp. PCC 7524]AFY51348.1 hypothetical protein Nos7524_5658 [Nostoc sp. PCC 7524]